MGRKKKEKRQPMLTVGTSMILVTLVLIALVTFATLSYVTAKSDYNMSLQAARSTEKYYVAYEEANRLRYEIETELKKFRNEAFSEDDYAEMIRLELKKGDCKVSDRGGTEYISYSVNVEEGRFLNVELKVNEVTNNSITEVTSFCVEGEPTEEPSLKLLF